MRKLGFLTVVPTKTANIFVRFMSTLKKKILARVVGIRLRKVRVTRHFSEIIKLLPILISGSNTPY